MENVIRLYERIPCSYYFLLIIATLIEDQQSGIISKEKLFGATRILMEELDNDDFKKEFRSLELNLVYKYDDLEKEFQEFLSSYDHMVYLSGENIYLKGNINYEMLVDELGEIAEEEDFDSLSIEIRLLRKQERMRKYLNLYKIHELYLGFIKKETKIEKAYLELLTTKNPDLTKEKIRTLLKTRDFIYRKICKLGIHVIEALQDEEPQGDIEYEKEFPIDFDLWDKYEEYLTKCHFDKDEVTLLDNLLLIYQKAVFGFKNLSEEKFLEDLRLLNIELYNFDPDEDFLEANSNKAIVRVLDNDLIFYLTYIKKLEELLSLYGQNADLELTKIRLIYTLDDYELGLYESENREKVLEEKKRSKKIEGGNVKSFKDYFSQESLFLIQDIFEGKERNFSTILKKVAFVATYYELTKDEEIKKELFHYTSSEHYFEFYRFIVSVNKQKSKF